MYENVHNGGELFTFKKNQYNKSSRNTKIQYIIHPLTRRHTKLILFKNANIGNAFIHGAIFVCKSNYLRSASLPIETTSSTLTTSISRGVHKRDMFALKISTLRPYEHVYNCLVICTTIQLQRRQIFI